MSRVLPVLSREQLEIHSSGRISSIFGSQFAPQDVRSCQIRLPKPPLLLLDRVTRIDAVPGSMGIGSIWSEVDVSEESWYLHHGRMPFGILLEASQAILVLLSWLGVDLVSPQERVFRLLGGEVSLHGPLPEPGEKLVFATHVSGYASKGSTQLVFLRSECKREGKLLLDFRRGQAGLFTHEELLNAPGIEWDPAGVDHRSETPIFSPLVPAKIACAFDTEQVRAFVEGRLYDCFGPGFELGGTHIRSPRSPAGRMQLFDSVDRYDPEGGPWKRGYLRATKSLSPADWIFDAYSEKEGYGPATLMFETGLQLMSFYLAALGFTLKRDGWRLEPAHDQTYRFLCRRQPTRSCRKLTYELFVREVSNQALPTLWADILCSIDGIKAFHAQRLSLRLIPDWPLIDWSRGAFLANRKTENVSDMRRLGGLRGAPSYQTAEWDGFRFDYASLLALAWGRPCDAFGRLYQDVDPARQVGRLPGPPFHFVSRITRIEGEPGSDSLNSIEAEYDLAAETWFFEQGTTGKVDVWLLLEIGMQPCGWLIFERERDLFKKQDVFSRNLDGKASILKPLPSGPATLRIRSKRLSVARIKDVSLESFEIEIFVISKGNTRSGQPVEEPLAEIKTRFGFFPKSTLYQDQIGLPPSESERNRFEAPGNCFIDFANAFPHLPGPMLRMIDQIDCIIPDGGKHGLGYLRAHKAVNPNDWIFKAHFFQDPVQPGSLGIEALYQLLRFYLIHTGLATEMEDPRFETLGGPIEWKYRGQITPFNSLVGLELEISERASDEDGVFATAEGWLWVDGKRIYHVENIGLRVRSRPSVAISRAELPAEIETVIDLSTAPWLKDHCPTYGLPAFPMMAVADLIASDAKNLFPELQVVGLHDLQMERWILFDKTPVRLKRSLKYIDSKTLTGSNIFCSVGAPFSNEGMEKYPGNPELIGLEITVFTWREAATPALSRFEPAARGKVLLATKYPEAPEPLPSIPDLHWVPTPYEEHRVFHGPAFRLLKQLKLGPNGSSALLDAFSRSVPVGTLSPALLDAALHGIPRDRPSLWCPEIGEGFVMYPSEIKCCRFYGPTPTEGMVVCNTIFTGLIEEKQPAFHLELLLNDQLWATFETSERLFPLGNLRSVSPILREAFLTHRYAPGVSLSRFIDGVTLLSDSAVQELGWMPGGFSHVYAVKKNAADITKEIAIKEHVARIAKVHPSLVIADGGSASAVAATQPFLAIPLTASRESKQVTVTTAGPPSLKFDTIYKYWLERLGVGHWILLDLLFGLAEKFIRSFEITAPVEFSNLGDSGLIFLANHQVQVESVLFDLIGSPLIQARMAILSRIENRTSWLGELARFFNSYPGVNESFDLILFNRQNQTSLIPIAQKMECDLAQGTSILIHIEGAQALVARHPVTRMSSLFIDLAHRARAPIIPVRFAGGLPLSPAGTEPQFPFGFGQQDYYVGRPLLAEELESLPYAKRRGAVLDAINALGPPLEEELPNPGDSELAAAVAQSMRAEGLASEQAVLVETLARLQQCSEQTHLINEARKTRRLSVDSNERGRWLAEFAQWLLGDIEVRTE